MSAGRWTLLYIVAARLLLALSLIGESLKEDHQLASPLNAYPRLREGTYLFNHGISPYSGGTFRHSPLFLPFFSWLPDSPYLNASLWTLVDCISAWALVSIWNARSGGVRSRGVLLASMYLINPYLFLPSLATSTASFDNALLLLAIKFACERRTPPCLFSLAFASQLSLPSILLLPPILLLLLSDAKSHLASPKSFSTSYSAVAPVVLEFFAYFATLTGAATIATGGWSWAANTWGAGLILPDLTPNPGLWWYFFTEMFDHFRPFFLMVFSMHLLIYVAPVCIKFQHDPLYATFILVGLIAMFKPYPTLADAGLFLTMFTLFPETYRYLRYPIVTALLHLHAFLLLPLFHHLWVGAGTGNANFFYASSLVFGVANGGAILDAIWAGLRIAVGEVGEDYAVMQE
ncbi:GPI transamidase subunit PIG-U [Vararia minispora EC-137]|uniref:GPI transamidase subunit PIG-U n=1 Tax=Vararia minispora EC-137 TaxID=1314806 RepID=A0ACB8QGQ9_9AGAM|nr:GPI transamidase subunit PIG-U [Vararia minispora EC-137]